jgi:mRNA-degrading endonuclease toxin of MazEF toxin-antitoxin module
VTPAPSFQRGQLYWAAVPYLPEKPLDILRRSPAGEQRVAMTFKSRPVLIVQNDRYNADLRYNYLLVAPVHSLKPSDQVKLRRVNYPSDLFLETGEAGLTQPSVIFLNQLRTLHKNLTDHYIGQLLPQQIEEMDAKLAFCLGLL